MVTCGEYNVLGASKVEMEILSLLKSGEHMYGLEMVKASSLLKRGSIYVYLGRMQDKEWIKSKAEKNPADSGMPRRLYWITNKGQTIHNRVVEREVRVPYDDPCYGDY